MHYTFEISSSLRPLFEAQMFLPESEAPKFNKSLEYLENWAKDLERLSEDVDTIGHVHRRVKYMHSAVKRLRETT